MHGINMFEFQSGYSREGSPMDIDKDEVVGGVSQVNFCHVDAPSSYESNLRTWRETVRNVDYIMRIYGLQMHHQHIHGGTYQLDLSKLKHFDESMN